MDKEKMHLSEKIENVQDSLISFIPELVLTTGLVVLLIVGLVLTRRSAQTRTIIFSLGAFVLLFTLTTQWVTIPTPPTFHNMITVDRFSIAFHWIFDLCALCTLGLSFRKDGIHNHPLEFVLLLLTTVLGAHLLVMSTNLIMIFISLEMISIPSYVLTGIQHTKKGSEGSLKYFLFGAVASAIMLYGFSLLYGITGTLDISSVLTFPSSTPVPLLWAAYIFILAGFLFKVASMPMHFWVPDVYESAPTPLVAFFSVVPKLAGIAVLARFASAVNHPDINWPSLLGLIAILTITLGNLAAWKQTHVKRLMAYSSIAQSGFLLIGLATFSSKGLHFLFFYSATYAIANYLVFAYIQAFEQVGKVQIADFAGSGKVFVWPHIFLLIGFISLTGIPPTAGFTGKLFLFSALWESYQGSGNNVLLCVFVIGLINTVLSLFYYLKIPLYAFLKDSQDQFSLNLKNLNLFGILLVIALLILFLQPNLLMSWINKINFVF